MATKRKRPPSRPSGLAEEERPFAHDEIMRGVPARKVKRLIERGVLDAKQVHRVIPARTFNRRVAKNEPLKPAEADGIARLIRVTEWAMKVFRDEKFTRDFLRLPNPALGNRIPNELVETEAGAREVEAIITRIAYGDYT
jgi:putative toxin-antitoxin system antitoxin component (TIGR02293 family)